MHSLTGTLSFVVVNTLEDISTAIEVSVFMRIALKWTAVGSKKQSSNVDRRNDADSRGDRSHRQKSDKKCCCTWGVFSMCLAAFLVSASAFGASFEALLLVPSGAPFGTQSSFFNAGKLYTFATVIFVFMIGNIVFGCRVARRLRSVIARHRHGKKLARPAPVARASPRPSSSRDFRREDSTQAPTGWQSLSQSSIGSAGSASSHGSGHDGTEVREPMRSPLLSPIKRGPEALARIGSGEASRTTSGRGGGTQSACCQDRRLLRIVLFVGVSTVVAMVRRDVHACHCVRSVTCLLSVCVCGDIISMRAARDDVSGVGGKRACPRVLFLPSKRIIFWRCVAHCQFI